MAVPIKIRGSKSREFLKVNDDGNLTKVDKMTDAVATIEYEHHEIHGGSSYVHEDHFTLNSGGTAFRRYLIETPDSQAWAHMVVSVMGSQDTNIVFTEVTDLGYSTGTEVFSRNRNRNSSKTSSVVLSHTPGGGTLDYIDLFSAQWGIATHTGGSGGAGGNIRRPEIILKPNFQYSLLVTALSANDNFITVAFDWYEHTDKS